MQANKDILLNAMDIFVKEPLLDWQTRANNQARQQSKLYKYILILLIHYY